MRALSIVIAFWALVVSALAEDASATGARVHALVLQLANKHNAARLTPGAELLHLTEAALPALREEFAKPNLDWWTQAGIQRAIETLTSQQAGQELDEYTRGVYESCQLNMVGRWRTSGVHDVRWDSAVEECLAELVLDWSEHPKRHGDEVEHARIACERAVKAGCVDPYITYLSGRLRWITDGNVDEEAAALMQKGAVNILDSGWHPLDKCFVLWRASLTIQWSWKWQPQGEQARQVELWMGAIPDLLIAAAKDPQTRIESILMVADAYIDFMHEWKHQRVVAFRGLHAALEAALPNSAIPPLVSAEFHLAWAWDARGSGWAKSVTEEGWRLMRERMTLAQAAIALAQKREPNCNSVPVVALELANGTQASLDEVNQLLKRSMALHPGNRDGLINVADYLQPKWHGTAEQLLDHGRHCLALGDWANKTPQVLLLVHSKLADSEASGRSQEADEKYYQQQEVWKDIEAVYQGWLAESPDSIEAKSQYLWYAFTAGKFDLARKLDDALQGHPRLSSVGGAKGYARIHSQLQLQKLNDMP